MNHFLVCLTYLLRTTIFSSAVEGRGIYSLGTPRTYRFGSTSSRASGATCVHNHLPFEFMTLFQAVYIYIYSVHSLDLTLIPFAAP